MVSVATWTVLAALGAGGETALLDFTASWCGPCQAMAPVIHRLQAEGYPVRQIDVDQHPELAARFGVTSVPCLVMLLEGREVDRIVGAADHDRLTQMFAAARFAPRQDDGAIAIRGQSPDRLGLGGRLRQLVGGRRAATDAVEQPPATPPASASGEYPGYGAAANADAGPEPPAVLGDLGRGASTGPAGWPPEPETASLDDAAQTPGAINAPAQPWNPPGGNGSLVGAADGAWRTPAAREQPATYEADGARSVPATLAAAPEEQAMAASVRLRIDDGQFYSYATGSLIDVRPDGEALILTCGHVFRESQGRGAISVELFGPHRQGPLPARLVAYDLNTDLGLVAVRAGGGLASVAVAGREAYVREGQRVFSIGCDRGAEPSLREGRLVGVNRYLGTPNVVATGRPVVGRSGGGLFDAQGRLIGVCRFADSQADEGIYVAHQAIHTQLAQWGLQGVLEAPTAPRAGPATSEPVDLAAASTAALPSEESPASFASPAGVDRPADFDYTQMFPRGASPGEGPLEVGAAVVDRSGGGAVESVFVVRIGSRGEEEVMLLERPSPAFFDQLARESTVRVTDDAPLPQAVRAAAEMAGASAPAALVRGQSPWRPSMAAAPGDATR